MRLVSHPSSKEEVCHELSQKRGAGLAAFRIRVPLFADGFESGDLAAWNGSTP